jgi:hypothetical protein
MMWIITLAAALLPCSFHHDALKASQLQSLQIPSSGHVQYRGRPQTYPLDMGDKFGTSWLLLPCALALRSAWNQQSVFRCIVHPASTDEVNVRYSSECRSSRITGPIRPESILDTWTAGLIHAWYDSIVRSLLFFLVPLSLIFL